MPPTNTPTIDAVRDAARRLASVVLHTPFIRSSWLSDAIRADVWLKLEFLQPTGSFKVRGAANALHMLKARQPEARVVTASAGNHGLAVAWAAAALGIPARVHLPVTAPAAKRDGIARLGAEIVDAPSYDEAETGAHDEAARLGSVYLSPYNHPDVIAGASTVAVEMFGDQPDLDTLIVPLGGGGLLSGCAIVASHARLIGAEADASPVFTSALAAGRVVPVVVRPTLADGLAGNMESGSCTFDIVRDTVDRVLLVKEPSIREAMRGLIAHERLIVEGAAATAVGALLDGGVPLAGRRIGVVLTGRNVDADVIRRIL